MANHGALVCAGSLPRAMWLAVELEALARQYILSLQAGGPVLLSEAQVEAARKKFRGYGLK
jgi:L-fuculose-phosphate aldolase